MEIRKHNNFDPDTNPDALPDSVKTPPVPPEPKPLTPDPKNPF
jgi:hypothetical protein